MMIKTVHLEVVKHSHVFQSGCSLELAELIVDGALKGYTVPDTGNGTAGTVPAKNVRKRTARLNETGEYYGKCMLTRVSNFNKNSGEDDKASTENIGIVRPEQVRVIHYPDCQQIVFHMPEFAYHAGTFKITNLVTCEVIVETAVKERLSGSTMMALDSLPLRPGFYSMEADWPNGWTHQIRFIKFPEGFPNVPYPDQPVNVRQVIKNQELHLLNLPAPENPPPYSSYRHPAGNVSVIQNEKEYRQFDSNSIETDVQKFKNDLASKFGSVVAYSQDGRGGNIFYREQELEIKFEWEFAGGNAVVMILIPEEKYWENHTKTPLSRRNEILNFVSQKVIEDQAPGCGYQIYSNSISILRK